MGVMSRYVHHVLATNPSYKDATVALLDLPITILHEPTETVCNHASIYVYLHVAGYVLLLCTYVFEHAGK